MQAKFQFTFLFLFFCFSLMKLEGQNVTGSWSGAIEVPSNSLEIIFHISKDQDGNLSGKFDVPQQGAVSMPVGKVVATKDSLFLTIPSILGKYKGAFVTNDSVAGQWSQAGNTLALHLKRNGEVKKRNRPQTPKPPFAYAVEEVEYTNPQSGYKLAGTLTYPENANNYPAVILITGSGAQDRDETLYEHKPFFVIADYFTRNGIAVLRVDDRGVGGSEGSTSEATSADFAIDVKQGVRFLKTRKEVNPNKIGLLGHSEGGMIAPMVANQSEDVAFIIMMAGLGIPGDSLLIEQTRLLARTSGMPEQRINAQLFMTNGIINILKRETEPEKRSESLRNALTGGMYKQMDTDRQKMIDGQLRQYDNNWFSFLVSYDPIPDLLKVKCPVLALNGEKDLQVPPDQNLPAIEKALKKGGNTCVKIMELPHLNHLFQTCETGLPQEYAQIEETISTEVLQIMKDWIIETTEK